MRVRSHGKGVRELCSGCKGVMLRGGMVSAGGQTSSPCCPTSKMLGKEEAEVPTTLTFCLVLQGGLTVIWCFYCGCLRLLVGLSPRGVRSP